MEKIKKEGCHYYVYYRGKWRNLPELSKIILVKTQTLRDRLERGAMTVEDLTRPVNGFKHDRMLKDSVKIHHRKLFELTKMLNKLWPART